MNQNERNVLSMEQLKKIWSKLSYETIIFMIIMLQFLMNRSTEMQAWSAAFSAMNYSMGRGSRLLIGSIYKLFYGDYLDATVAYTYSAVGIMLTILVLSITLGRLIRLSLACRPEYKNVIFGAVAAYVAAPFSISYNWNAQNFGRFDIYMMLIGLLTLLAGLVIRNVYVKFLVITILGVIGLAIHQGFAFLYYPMTLIVLCHDSFEGNRFHAKHFIAAFISGIIEVVVAIYFQFFSSINYDSPAAIMQAIVEHSNIAVVEHALEIEYFGGMEEQLTYLTPEFFQNDAPWSHSLVIVLLLAPILLLYLLVWRDVFHHQRSNHVKLLQSPYFYVALTHLCFVPMFLIHTDWGRNFAPLFAMPTFIFLYFFAKKDESMIYAFEKMKQRIKNHPWYFVITLIWLATFDGFGARYPFQNQAEMLYNFLDYGFFQ